MTPFNSNISTRIWKKSANLGGDNFENEKKFNLARINFGEWRKKLILAGSNFGEFE